MGPSVSLRPGGSLPFIIPSLQIQHPDFDLHTGLQENYHELGRRVSVLLVSFCADVVVGENY